MHAKMLHTDLQTNVRLPAALKEYIQEQASRERRSLTAEVVMRLERTRQQDLAPSMAPSSTQQPTQKGNS